MRDNIEELTDAYDKAHKEKRRWKVIFLINLVILLCILLYSCSLSLYLGGLNAYTVVWSADMLEVQKDNIKSMSTKELIDESVKNGYVSNAIEFYYDPVDNLIYDTAGGSTTYYSVPSLNNNIVGYELKYDIKDFKKGGRLQDSITKVANQKFIWGINDGSSQMAVPESTDLKFNGSSYRKISEATGISLAGLHGIITKETGMKK